MQTVLVLGGYGFFGQRIGAALASGPSLRVLLAGRDRSRATAAAHAIGLPPEQAVAIDARDLDLARTLTRLDVDILIHTAGPYQRQDYSVARAAIEADCHYIDLADGRQFVAGIDSLADSASARGISVISGASSVPALSSAVVDRYLQKFRRLDSDRYKFRGARPRIGHGQGRLQLWRKAVPIPAKRHLGGRFRLVGFAQASISAAAGKAVAREL